jgi:hypothetical protein
MLQEGWGAGSFLPLPFNERFLAVFQVKQRYDQLVRVPVDSAFWVDFNVTLCDVKFKLAMIFVPGSVKTNKVG